VRRLLPVLVGVAVVVAGLVGLMAFASGRDDAGLSGGATAGPGEFESRSKEQPPTSGPHEQANVTGEDAVTDDALLTALDQGNVVIAYPQTRPPAAREQLRRELTGPFDAELAAAGQMVILVRRPDSDGIQALAYQRRLEAQDPADPQLKAFAEAWLGKGRETAGP